MPLYLVRSSSHDLLWSACETRLLEETGQRTGPTGFPSHLWISHRSQRDALFASAAARGLPGWLAPPVSFFSDLRKLFGIETRPLGLLTSRLLVARTAVRFGRRMRRQTAGTQPGPARVHMIDGVFGELLPEGVTPSELRTALDRLGGDEFGRQRNLWVADTYEAFLEELRARKRYDPRAIHARIAEQIERGKLQEAIRGAERLHIYGITSLRTRHRLFVALARQGEVDVFVYLPQEDEPSEWDSLAHRPAEVLNPVEETTDAVVLPAPPRVQPVPDVLREANWVARQVKQLLLDGLARPHQIAVVARTGEPDTRRVYRALEAAGIPATARIRTRFSQIPSLRALLELFNAEARGWTYRSLRQVLASPYFGAGVNLRVIDYVARHRRVRGWAEWDEALQHVLDMSNKRSQARLARAGVFVDQVEKDLRQLRALRDTVAPIQQERSERAWIILTLKILSGEWLRFRRLLCRPTGNRQDIVRLDQRGVSAVESLLREWRELVGQEETFGPGEWHTRLRHLFEANELVLSTPLRAGIQVLEAHEAALTPYRYTFLVHANDGVFPRISPARGIFSDAERQKLRELGLPLAHREEDLRRERTLWRAVTGGTNVTVTYRTTDANGVPLLPSLMVPAHDPSTELPRTLHALERTRGPVTSRNSAPVSLEEHHRAQILRLAAFRRSGQTARFQAANPWFLQHAILGAFADELRAGGLDSLFRSAGDLTAGLADTHDTVAKDPATVFGIERAVSEQPHPWNGQLRDPRVLALLEERFGNAYVWSATQLQQYGTRPFDFLLQRILRLEEVEEAEEETTPLAFGSVAHTILERFYRELKDSLPPGFDDRAAEAYDSVVEEVFGEFEADVDEWLGLPPLWTVRREDIRETVRAFLESELDYLSKKKETPFLLEHRFGEGNQPPLCIEGTDRRRRTTSLVLRGRIDRVDRVGSEAKPSLRVIDYKSSFIPSPKGYQDGSLLQTGLYMKAVELLGHGRASVGVLRSIKKRTWNGAELKRSGLEDVLSFALSIPARVRSGLFEAVQARSVKLNDWQPGREITRTQAQIASGSRFDTLGHRPDAGVEHDLG